MKGLRREKQYKLEQVDFIAIKMVLPQRTKIPYDYHYFAFYINKLCAIIQTKESDKRP